MSIAARQLAEHLTGTYSGIRISRNSCRPTANGSISQHSAYGGPDPYYSNAIDLFAPATLSRIDQQDWLDVVYGDIDGLREEWSVRLMLWRVKDHYGHIHVDFWPTLIAPTLWCGSAVLPTWVYSHGTQFTSRNPEPENGRYDGDGMTYQQFRTAEFDLWTNENIVQAYDAGMFQDPNRDGFIDYWVVKRDARTPDEKARFMTDYYAHLWRRT